MVIRASLGRMVCRKRRIASGFAVSDLVAVGMRMLSLPGYQPSDMILGYHTISNRLPQKRQNSVKPIGLKLVRSFNSKLELPPDVPDDVRKFEVVTGDVKLLDQKIKSAEAELNTRNEEESMKIEFERDFKPLLLPSCLLLPCSLDDDLTAFLHGQTHSIIKREPLYLSAFDVMTTKENMCKEVREFFISFIINERVMVTEEWKQSYGDIEMSVYDIAADGPDFYRGESDASFVENADKKDGLAKLSAVLWKNGQVIWSKVYEDVKCPSINDAEVLAALALQLKCVELGFVKKLKHFSDSGYVVNVITGKHTIEMSDPQRLTYMLLRSLKGKFKTLIAALRPRQLMFLSAALLRCDGIPTSPMVEDILKQWQPHLKGAPLFRIYQNKRARNIIKTYGERANEFKDKVDSIYYLGVKNEQKFDVLMQLISTLSPDRLYLVIDKFEEKPLEFQKLVSEYLPEFPLKEGTCSTFWLNKLQRKQCAEFMPEEKTGQPIQKKTGNAAEGTSVGKEELVKRKLYVVFDASLPSHYYFREDSCVIILTEPHELDWMKNTGIKEISTATFVRFHGVAHKKVEVKKKKEKDGKKRRRGKKGSEHGDPERSNATRCDKGHGDPGRSYGAGRPWMTGGGEGRGQGRGGGRQGQGRGGGRQGQGRGGGQTWMSERGAGQASGPGRGQS